MSNIRKLITGLLAPAQLLEDTLLSLIAQRNADDAIGKQLTELGTLVGRKRQGVTDDDLYRRYVKATILSNRSDGQAETHYTIVRLVLGDTLHTLWFVNEGEAAFTFRVETLALDWDIAEIVMFFLRKAASAGVRPVLEFTTDDPDDAFAFSDTDDYIDGGGEGFADSDDYEDGPAGGLVSWME